MKTENRMQKHVKSANRSEHQNRKTEPFWPKNRKTDPKNSQNRKTENPKAPLFIHCTRQRFMCHIFVLRHFDVKRTGRGKYFCSVAFNQEQ